MPQEYRLILKNVDQPGYTPDMACYLRHGGYEALKKALALPAKDPADGLRDLLWAMINTREFRVNH